MNKSTIAQHFSSRSTYGHRHERNLGDENIIKEEKINSKSGRVDRCRYVEGVSHMGDWPWFCLLGVSLFQFTFIVIFWQLHVKLINIICVIYGIMRMIPSYILYITVCDCVYSPLLKVFPIFRHTHTHTHLANPQVASGQWYIPTLLALICCHSNKGGNFSYRNWL